MAWNSSMLAVLPHHTAGHCLACGHVSKDNRQTWASFVCMIVAVRVAPQYAARDVVRWILAPGTRGAEDQRDCIMRETVDQASLPGGSDIAKRCREWANRRAVRLQAHVGCAAASRLAETPHIPRVRRGRTRIQFPRSEPQEQIKKAPSKAWSLFYLFGGGDGGNRTRVIPSVHAVSSRYVVFL
jgi:hypothetical protein